MTLFDIMGIASRVPYELIQKLECDLPKFQQLQALEQQAEPHVNALLPLIKEAETIWGSISPDIKALLSALQPTPEAPHG